MSGTTDRDLALLGGIGALRSLTGRKVPRGGGPRDSEMERLPDRALDQGGAAPLHASGPRTAGRGKDLRPNGAVRLPHTRMVAGRRLADMDAGARDCSG